MALFHYLCLIGLIVTIKDFTRAFPSTLRFVNLLYRHGDRTPLFTFPTDKYGLKAWPQGPGQLTEIGIEQHFRLGQYYRRRYDGFINNSYSLHELTVHSSDVDRCLMSAESHLCGFYGPSDGYRNMSCQPVPIHTRPELEDNYLAMSEACPQWSKALDEEQHSQEAQDLEKRNQEFFKFIKEKSGMPYLNSSNIFYVRDTLYIQNVHNFTLPDWANETVMEKLTEINGITFSYLFKTPRERRLKGGTLLKLMIGNMESKMNGSLDERAKMAMYSGHDSTILALLETMNLYDDVAPEYAWSVLLELHEDPPKSFYTNVFYKNDSSDPKRLTMPGCETNCPIAKFKELTKDYIPGDWEEECKLLIPANKSHKLGLGTTPTLAVVSMMLLALGEI